MKIALSRIQFPTNGFWFWVLGPRDKGSADRQKLGRRFLHKFKGAQNQKRLSEIVLMKVQCFESKMKVSKPMSTFSKNLTREQDPKKSRSVLKPAFLIKKN